MFPYLAANIPLPIGFSHAKVQRSSGVKHRYANGSRICPAAFPNRRCPFNPPSCRACRVGYSVKSPAVCLLLRPFPTV